MTGWEAISRTEGGMVAGVKSILSAIPKVSDMAATYNNSSGLSLCLGGQTHASFADRSSCSPMDYYPQCRQRLLLVRCQRMKELIKQMKNPLVHESLYEHPHCTTSSLGRYSIVFASSDSPCFPKSQSLTPSGAIAHDGYSKTTAMEVTETREGGINNKGIRHEYSGSFPRAGNQTLIRPARIPMRMSCWSFSMYSLPRIDV